jgi:hypothetical protein
MFIAERLDRVLIDDVPSECVGVEWLTVQSEFAASRKPQKLERKLKERLGKLQYTSRSERQFKAMVGSDPEPDKHGKINFRGFFGWRRKGFVPARPQSKTTK